jgi:taurine dioxygenase
MAATYAPLCAGFGLETRDVDLARALSDAEFAGIEAAFFRGQVLVLRAQSLTASQFLAFAQRLGPPEPHVIEQFHHPAHADILILSNRRDDGRPLGLADAGTYFHTDYSYLQVPARATMLYSIEVPARGGDTLFANQYAAYDDLTDAMKARLAPLLAVHHYGNRDVIDETSRTAASRLNEEQKARMPLVTHPIVRRHPVTGRKALYAVSGSSYGIVGMGQTEARALLEELAAHATQPRYCYSLAYGVGDVVIWDNASLLHSATLVHPDDPRTLWRITVKEPRLAAASVLGPAFAADATRDAGGRDPP